MKKKGLMLAGFVVVCLLFLYISSLRSQLNDALTLKANYQEEVKALSQVKDGEAKETNREFLKQFFNYSDIKERNKSIRPLMTAQGYQSIQMTNSQQTADIKVYSSNLKSYERILDKKTVDFISELDLSVKFNDVTNTEKTLVKTTLLHIQGEGWKVEKVEFVGDKGIKD